MQKQRWKFQYNPISILLLHERIQSAYLILQATFKLLDVMFYDIQSCNHSSFITSTYEQYLTHASNQGSVKNIDLVNHHFP